MDKPQPKTLIYYDYHECRNYLQEKYGYNERDYAGHFTTHNNIKPYLNFWHWLIDHEEISNGSYVTFSRENLAEWKVDEVIPDWAAEIYTRYLDEFADALGTVEFCTYW